MSTCLTMPWGRKPSLALALAAPLLVASCAQLPPPSERAALNTPSELASIQAFKAPAAPWPVNEWWRAYGDAQLNALVDEALASAPDLAAATARMQRAQAATQLAGSALEPQLSANAAVSADKLSYNHLVPRTPATQGWNDYGRATLDLRWELDFWGRSRAALAAATSELEARQAELAQVRLALSAGMALEYAELNRLHASRELALRSVDIRARTAELFKQRHEHGLETLGSLREAEARRAAAEGQVLALDERMALQRHRLAALLGAGPDRGRALATPKLALDRRFGLPPDLGLDLLGRRPDVQAARLQAQAQASRISQKTAEFYPNVNLSAFVGLQSLGLDRLLEGDSFTGGVGPAISLPLFTGGRLRAELRGAEAGYAEAVARYNATLTRALQDVADAATSQQALGGQLAKAEEAVNAAAQAHRIARNRYEGGLANFLEVLSAEDGWLAAQSQLTQLRSQSFTLDIALQRALGGGFQLAQR
ncbi:MAG: efflux transporter outer membrane subunit [Limnohabitans sp.]